MVILRMLFSTYIFASILNPFEIIDTTAQFISLLFTHRPSKASHVANIFTLSIGFIIVYHLIAIRYLIELSEPFLKKKKNTTQTPVSVIDNTLPMIKKEKPVSAEKKMPIIKEKESMIKDKEPIPVVDEKKLITPEEESVIKAEDKVAPEEKPVIKVEDKVAPGEKPVIKVEDKVTPIPVEEEKPVTKVEEEPVLAEQEPIINEASSDQVQPHPVAKEPMIEEQHIVRDLIVKDQSKVVDELVITKPTVPTPKAPIIQDDDDDVKANHQKTAKEENKVAQVDLVVPEDTIPDTSSSIKDQYYSELLKKDNNMMSLSDNLQRIFDEPLSPSPDENKLYLDDVPALTPPHPSSSSAAGSTLSRKSSLASQHSQFKSRLQLAMQKVAKSGPKTEEPNINKKRFSTIRLTKRKSKIMDSDTAAPSVIESEEIVPKKSISTKFQKGLKNTGKRFSKMFS